jgi:hypothetical protein
MGLIIGMDCKEIGAKGVGVDVVVVVDVVEVVLGSGEESVGMVGMVKSVTGWIGAGVNEEKDTKLMEGDEGVTDEVGLACDCIILRGLKKNRKKKIKIQRKITNKRYLHTYAHTCEDDEDRSRSASWFLE